MIKIRNMKVIASADLDKLVQATYGRTYCLQQQNGCAANGSSLSVCVPEDAVADFAADSIPEEVNGEEMGVSFAAWLTRDPAAPVAGRTDFGLQLFWERNFYPALGAVMADLHSRGLIPAGEYMITIDW